MRFTDKDAGFQLFTAGASSVCFRREEVCSEILSTNFGVMLTILKAKRMCV
jgi:hypothetical protein